MAEIPTVKLTVVTVAVLQSALQRYVDELQQEAFLAFVSGDMGKFTRRMAVLSSALPLLEEMASSLPDNAMEEAVSYFANLSDFKTPCPDCGGLLCEAP